jgi:hypothetical protein
VRQRALLSVSLPLAAAGCLAGHAAAYTLVGSSRRDVLVHGYLSFAPQFLALCIAVLALALGLRLSGRLMGRPSAWPFAVLPPLAFCAQELIERLVAGLPAHAVLEPAVYAGLAAQLPIAAAAFLFAKTLLRVTDAAARALARRPPVTVLRPALVAVPGGARPPARTLLALDRLSRAPPRL